MADESNDKPGRSDLLSALAGHFSGGLPIEDLPKDAVGKLGEALDSGGLLRSELVAFWNLLEDGLGRTGYRRPSGEEIRLLNLACGPCFEGAVLASFFERSGSPGASRNTVRFFGMDLRGKEIDDAKRRYATTEKVFKGLGLPSLHESDPTKPNHSSVEFFADDATRLVGYREIPKEFEIIFLRHQNVWHDRLIWQRIYEFALARLGSDSMLIITSYFDREQLIALDLLKTLGARLLTSEANPDSRELDYPGKSVDRHMAVFGRMEPGVIAPCL